MNRSMLRTLAFVLISAILASFALAGNPGMSLAQDISYYRVTSFSYRQAAGVPFAVSVSAHNSSHGLVTDNTITVAISSNSPAMVFDTNNNGVFGEESDGVGTLSGGRLYFHARDTAACNGAVITVTDGSGNSGSSDAFVISETTVVSADGWAWQNPLPQGNDLWGISGRSNEDVFAVGDAGAIMRYNGRTWTPMSSGSTKDIHSVWATPSFEVFAVGDDGVLYFDGTSWSTMRGDNPLRDIWGVSRSEVIAVGDGGVIIRYDGASWSAMNSGSTVGLKAVWGSSSSDVFAVGENSTVLHYGNDWASSTVTENNTTLHDVWGSSSSDVFAVGDAGAVLHFDGATWTVMNSGTSNCLYGVWGSSSSEVYAVGENGTVLHYDGATWVAMSSGTAGSLHGVWVSPTSDVMAVGGRGITLHLDGGQWLQTGSGVVADLRGIWGSSPSDVFAVGEEGTILHYRGDAWAAMNSGTTATLSGIWGSSASNVFAVGYNEGEGVILRYDGVAWSTMAGGSGGARLFGVWGSSATNVIAVGEQGTILRFNGTAWTPMVSGVTTQLNDVWGTSWSDFFAVGSGGVILHYDGHSWAAMDSGVTALLDGVGGKGSSDVYAVGGSTILHYDGSAWSKMAGKGYFGNDVWAVSPSDAYAVGGSGICHYDGTAWSRMTSGAAGKMYGIWGSSPTDVFTVGDGGVIVHYREPVLADVASITPSVVRQGQTVNVVIRGSNLNGATAVQFGEGVSTDNFTAKSAFITARITVEAGAAVGTRSLRVVTPDGSGWHYSGLLIEEVPASGPVETAPNRSWIIWVVVGVAAAIAVGVTAYLLAKRLKKGPKAAESPRPGEPVQAAEAASGEASAGQAASLEAVSALKARMASRGRSDNTETKPADKVSSSEDAGGSDDQIASGEEPDADGGHKGWPGGRRRK